MFKKKKVKKFEGVEHYGNMPKPHGHLLWLIDQCPFWSTIIVLFVFFAVEMIGFACLYSIISESSFNDSLNYSFFSVLGETVETSVKNSLWINRIISIQLILTNCVISFYMAVVLYKLISIKPELIKIENHLVFDPTSGTLRLRVVNVSRFNLTNVHIDAYFRIHIPDGGRHANAKLQLKNDNMILLHPYTFWNIATKPFLPKDSDQAKLDLERYDRDRIYEFIPDLLNEKYRSDDIEKAKRLDYRNLNVVITIKSPLFGADWVYYRSFETIDFVCGQLISVDPNTPGKDIIDWSKWEQYEDMSESYCEECRFADHCSIIKKSQRYTKIK